jgi:WD40 repeat protein
MWTAVGKSDGSIDVVRSELSEDGTSKKETNIQLPASGSFGNLVFVENANRLVSISRGLAASWNITGPRRLERKIWDELPADISVAGTGRLAAISSRSIKVFEPDGQSWQLTDDFPKTPSLIDPVLAGVAAASLSKDGTQLLLGRLGTLDLWSVSSRRRLRPAIIVPGVVTSVAIDPVQNYIAAGFFPESSYATPPNDSAKRADVSQVPVLWSKETGQPLLFMDFADDIPAAKDTSGSRPGNDDKMAIGVGFSPDGSSFAVTLTNVRRGGVNIYSGQDIRNRKDGTRVPLDSEPYFVAFSPDGKTIAVSQADGEVVLIDSTTKNVVGKLAKSGGEIGRLAFSSDGTILAGQELERGIALWDVASRSLLGSILRNRNSPLIGIAFRPGDRALVTGDAQVDGMVEYDLRLESWIAQACEVAQRALTNDERSLYGIAQGKDSCEPK